jgi:hypothetical protein
MIFIFLNTLISLSNINLVNSSLHGKHCRDKSRTGSKMKTWQGYVHAGVVALSVWFCRETIFEALQWWNGRPPSDGLLLGFCILSAGLACVPIVALHFSHELVGKPFLSQVCHFCLFIFYLQPRGDLLRPNNWCS